VCAIKGSALTEGHVKLLKRFTERINFCLDSDMAGDTAARRGIEVAEAAGLDMKVTILSTGKDPDEAAREDPVGFKKAIRSALPVYDYFIASAAKRFDLGSAFGKRKASEELMPMLKNITNSVVQAHYVKKVAEEMDVSEDVVVAGMQQVRSYAVKPDGEEKKPEERETRQERFEMYLLSLLLQGDTKTLFSDLGDLTPGEFHHIAVKGIIESLGEYISRSDIFSPQDFAGSLPKEFVPVFDKAYLYDISSLLEDKHKFSEEWHATRQEIARVLIMEKIRKLTDLLKKEAKEEWVQEITELTEKLKKLEKSGSL